VVTMTDRKPNLNLPNTTDRKPLKMLNLPKHLEHFPGYLEIRGKQWSRQIITGVYTQAKQLEDKINGYGLYKAVIVEKKYPPKPGHVTGSVYGVYMYPLKARRK
jgi:hypothetical protein